MPAIIKITEPNDDWKGYKHYCNNAAYHDPDYAIGRACAAGEARDPDDCPTCEKIMTRYYVKYLESLLDKEYPNHEKYVNFSAGPRGSDTFDGWVVFFFESDRIEENFPAINWSMSRENSNKPPKILREKSCLLYTSPSPRD